MQNFLDVVRELCGMVMKHTFSDITEVWGCVKKLLSPDMPTDVRKIS